VSISFGATSDPPKEIIIVSFAMLFRNSSIYLGKIKDFVQKKSPISLSSHERKMIINLPGTLSQLVQTVDPVRLAC